MSDNTELLNEELDNTRIENLHIDEDQTHDNFKKYLKLFSIAMVAVVVILGAYYYYQNSSKEKEATALKEYDKTDEFIKAEDYDKALNGGNSSVGKTIGLQGIVNQYGPTNIANSAALEAGYILLEKKQTQKALEMFEKANNSESEIVKVGANAGLGATYEQMNKNADAAKFYEIASGLTTQSVLKNRYKYFAALNYDLSKNKDKAVQLYKDILNEDQYSEFAGLAKISLTKLGINFD